MSGREENGDEWGEGRGKVGSADNTRNPSFA